MGRLTAVGPIPTPLDSTDIPVLLRGKTPNWPEVGGGADRRIGAMGTLLVGTVPVVLPPSGVSHGPPIE